MPIYGNVSFVSIYGGVLTKNKNFSQYSSQVCLFVAKVR